jgi:GNAT superfamily N-acetyltransferase
MTGVLIARVDPRSADARTALERYLSEAAGRLEHPTFRAADLVDEVGDFAAPGGAFLLVRGKASVIGCGAVRTLAPGLGEIKRMWIEPGQRGHGLGSQLLGALEATSLELGHERVRLDTNGALREAVGLYVARGYRPIDRYNDNRDATHFFERQLGSRPGDHVEGP